MTSFGLILTAAKLICSKTQNSSNLQILTNFSVTTAPFPLGSITEPTPFSIPLKKNIISAMLQLQLYFPWHVSDNNFRIKLELPKHWPGRLASSSTRDPQIHTCPKIHFSQL